MCCIGNSIISPLLTLTPRSLRDDSCNMVSHMNGICLKPRETDVFSEKQRQRVFPSLKIEGATEKSFRKHYNVRPVYFAALQFGFGS